MSSRAKQSRKRKPAKAAPALMAVDGELTLPTARVQLVRFDAPGGLDHTIEESSAHWIDLSLTNRAPDTRGTYRDQWSAHRYERVGPLFIAPAQQKLRLRSAAPAHASIVCKLDARALKKVAGRELEWSERRLEASLDVASADLRRLMRKLAHEVRHPGLAYAAMVELLTQEIAIEVARFFAAVDAPATVGGLAPWRLKVIDERVSEARETPSLSELASLCNLSARQLARAFRTSRGSSVGNYILQTRIDTAKRLLATDASVTTIAAQLGYASLASFSFAFRRGAGVSPLQYRTRTLRRA